MSAPQDPDAPEISLHPSLEHFFEHSPVHLWMSSPTFTPWWASPGWLTFLGVDRHAPAFADWSLNVHPDDVERVRGEARAAIESCSPFISEHRIRRHDGQWRWVSCHGLPYRDSTGACVAFSGSIVDVTDRRQHEEQLQELHAHYASILDGLPAIVTVFDQQHRYQLVNREWERLTGKQRGDVIGRDVVEVMGAEFGRKVRELNAEAFQSREAVRVELASTTTLGTRTFLTQRTVLAGADGPASLVCGTATDITDLRQEEKLRRDLEQRLAADERLTSLGRMAGGIAHDFNNLLTGVLGHVELALSDLPAGAAGASHLRAALEAAQRGAQLSQQMLAYSGNQFLECEALEVGTLLDQLRATLEPVLPSNTPLSSSCEAVLPRVRADAHQLRQALTHLIQNACEACTHHRGPVRLVAQSLRIDGSRPSRCAPGTELCPGEYVSIEVRDRGDGMDTHTMEHAFEPFFSTRFVGRGLGLSHALGIVRAHGGGIEVESEPGRGTTVRVLLPVAAPA